MPNDQHLQHLQPIALSVAEVAVRIGVSEATARRLVERGELRATRLGRRVVVRVADLEKLLERSAVATQAA